jgi:hypothetical protein
MQQSLELKIRAQIEEITGKDRLKNELSDLSLNTGQGIRQDPLYQQMAQGLSPQQLAEAQRSVQQPFSLLGKQKTEEAQDLLQSILDDYSSYENPSLRTRQSHTRRATRLISSVGREFDDLSTRIEGELQGQNLSDEDKIIRRAELEEAKKAYEDLTDRIIGSFEKYLNPNSPASASNPNNPNNPNSPNSGGGIGAVLMTMLGGVGLGNIVSKSVQESIVGYREKLVKAQIGATYETAFSYDAMGSFTTGKQAQFSEWERTKRYDTDKEVARLNTGTAWTAGLGGVGAGMIAGSLFSPGVGTAIGAGAGFLISQFGGKEAEQKKLDAETEITKRQGQLQGELKMVNDLIAAMAPHVAAFRSWDTSSMRQRARQGGISVPNQIGYLQREQEIQEELAFGDAAGYYDPQEFRRSYSYARSQGLQGSQVYSTQRHRFMLGSSGDGNISELDFVKRVTESMYGNAVDPKKQLEVLESIRNIQLDMLKLNIKADTENARNIADIPRLLFGEGSTYGRMNEMGGTTIEALKQMTSPTSLAHEALLYQLLGAPGIIKFEEFKKGGIENNPEMGAEFFTNFGNLMSSGVGGTEQYMIIENMLKNMKVPQGMIPHFKELIADGKVDVTRGRYKKVGSEYLLDDKGEFLKGQKQTDGTIKDKDEKGADLYEPYSKEHEKATVTLTQFIDKLASGGKYTELFGNTLKDGADAQITLQRKYETIANKFVSSSEMIARSLNEQSIGIGAGASSIHASLTSLSNTFTATAMTLPKLMDNMKDAMDLSIGYYLKNMIDKGVIKVDNEEQLLKLLEKWLGTGTYKVYSDVFSDRYKNENKTDTKRDPENRVGSGTSGGPGKRARGGIVFPHEEYLVGEEGAEIFIPDTAGTIVNNNQMKQAGSMEQVSNNEMLSVLHSIKYMMVEIINRRKQEQPLNVTVVNNTPDNYWESRNREC